MERSFLLTPMGVLFTNISNGDYITQITKKTNQSRREINVKLLKDAGLIEYEKIGREIKLQLTNKGNKIKTKLLSIRKCVADVPNVENKNN